MNLKLAITSLALTGLLLTGCASNEAAEGTDTQDPTLQANDESTETKGENVTVPLKLNFITSLNAEEIKEEYENVEESDGFIEGYDQFKDMMVELMPIMEENFDQDTAYELKTGENVNYTPAFVIKDTDFDMSQTFVGEIDVEDPYTTQYEEFALEPQQGAISVIDKNTTRGQAVYNDVNGGTNMGGRITSIVYENDTYFVLLSSNIINTFTEEDPQGDDLIALFSSDEATEVYEEYLK